MAGEPKIAKTGGRVVGVAASRVGAIFGSALGPIGTAVGSAVGYVAGKLATKAIVFINKQKRRVGQIGAGLVVTPFAFMGVLLSTALGSGLASLGATVVGTLIGGPILIAIFMLIINNSAYMVPPSNSTAGGNVFFGEIPEGCPAPIWPVSLGQGQGYRMSQGPGGWASHDATGGLYPFDIEGIDISKYPQGGDGSNHLVIATHSGTVSIAGVDQYGGNFVVIRADCSPEVVTNYVHMWNLDVQTGQQVQAGDVLGVMGETGFASGIHVHYEFLTGDGHSKNRELHPPPYMTTPYIPETPPFGCVTYSECQIEIR